MIFMFDVDSYGFKVKLFASLFVDVVNLDQILRNLYGNREAAIKKQITPLEIFC